MIQGQDSPQRVGKPSGIEKVIKGEASFEHEFDDSGRNRDEEQDKERKRKGIMGGRSGQPPMCQIAECMCQSTGWTGKPQDTVQHANHRSPVNIWLIRPRNDQHSCREEEHQSSVADELIFAGKPHPMPSSRISRSRALGGSSRPPWGKRYPEAPSWWTYP